MKRRVFLERVVGGGVVIATTPFLKACKFLGVDGKKKVTTGRISIAHGSTVQQALANATPLSTRQTGLGTEIISVAGKKATKNGSGDDGFVVILNDTEVPSFALDQFPLLILGANTIEVRHVPAGVHGSNGSRVYSLSVDVV
jgi:hypothetical protein